MIAEPPAVTPGATAPKLDRVVQRPSRPYPGLRPFRSDEWSIFCGREAIAREVLYIAGEHGVTFVHGGSGCGKSSLVAAGVLPSLERDILSAGQMMSTATIRPSEGPVTALAAALAKQLGPPPPIPSEQPVADALAPSPVRDPADAWTAVLLYAEPDDLIARIDAAIAAMGLDLFCVVVDQFEEMFAWARERRASDAEALTRFIAAAVRGADHGPGAAARSPRETQRLTVLVTMRSDFLSQCALFPELGTVINTCQFLVPTLDERGLERAIREPAAMYGGEVAEGLVTRLVTEATANIDALPIMQHALMRMTERHLPADSKRWQLTLDDHATVTAGQGAGARAPGGAGNNALSVHADEVRGKLISRLGAGAADTIEIIFRALFDLDPGGRLVRRATPLTVLKALAGSNAAQVEPIVTEFAREGVNLLVLTVNPRTGEEIVDISHEALLRNWWRMCWSEERLKLGWTQQEADDAVTWRMLARVAASEEARLDEATLRPIRPLYKRLREAPERARRYLLKSEKLTRVEDEREWRAVVDLVTRSERRLTSRRRNLALLRTVAALVMIGVVIGLIIFARQRTKATAVAEQEATAAEDDQKLTVATYEARDRQLEARINILDQGTTTNQVLETRQEQILADVAASGSAAQATADRYMWIGDSAVTNLKESATGATVPASNVVAGTRYYVTQFVALRSAPPSPPNKSGPLVGSVRAGSFVKALAAPIRWAPSGQYWLKVEPDRTVRVFVQYATGDPAPLRAALGRIADAVPPAQQLQTATGFNQVRFCREEDKPTALAVAKVVADATGIAPQTRWIGRNGICQRVSAPGTIEVWMGDPSPRSPPKS